MFKVKNFNNLIIIRTLLSANNPYILSKPKEPASIWKSTDYAFPKTMGHSFNIFDANTRIITVEGLYGANKAKFAKRIANYFAMDFIDDFEEKHLYVFPWGKSYYDLSKYNPILPPSAKIYTREMFWNDKDPINKGKPLLLQLHHYYWRFFNCCKAMSHLFRTGNGMVMKRSPWSDNVLALTLVECGLMSKKAYEIYNLIRCESIPNLWRPHFIVYLKASPETVRQNLNSRNHWMKDACNYNDKFIETYQDILENQYLKAAKTYSRVITIDPNEYNIDDEEDFEFLMESMAKENRDYEEIDEFDPLFYDWTSSTHNKKLLSHHRRFFCFANECFVKSFPTHIIPNAIREGAYSEDDLYKIHSIAQRDERYLKDPWFDPKTTPWYNILYQSPKFNFAAIHNQPYVLMRRAYE